MKKLLRLLVSLTLLTGILTGCAGMPGKNNNTSVPGNTSVAKESVNMTEANIPQMRLYTDIAGREVEIPANPQRIITINMTAEAVAAGITPVGAAENWLTPLDDSQKEGIEPLGKVENLNFEKIIELEPDLIITPERVTDEDTWNALSKIAPTVVAPFFGDALENLRITGDILGREQEAEAWVSAYEKKVQEVKEVLSDIIGSGETALVLQVWEKSLYVFPPSTYPTIHEVLGLTSTVEDLNLTSGMQLSLEDLTEYSADYIFLVSPTTDADQQYANEVADSSIWRNLPATKNNRVYSIGDRLSSGNALALDWALDEVVRLMKPSRVNH